jgi:hypothetical protein
MLFGRSGKPSKPASAISTILILLLVGGQAYRLSRSDPTPARAGAAEVAQRQALADRLERLATSTDDPVAVEPIDDLPLPEIGTDADLIGIVQAFAQAAAATRQAYERDLTEAGYDDIAALDLPSASSSDLRAAARHMAGVRAAARRAEARVDPLFDGQRERFDALLAARRKAGHPQRGLDEMQAGFESAWAGSRDQARRSWSLERRGMDEYARYLDLLANLRARVEQTGYRPDRDGPGAEDPLVFSLDFSWNRFGRILAEAEAHDTRMQDRSKQAVADFRAGRPTLPRLDLPSAPVSLDEEALLVNGSTLALPTAIDNVTRLLGRPTRMIRQPARGRVAVIWDHLGVLAFVEFETGIVTSLTLSLHADRPQPWPREIYNGEFNLFGKPVDAWTSPTELNAALGETRLTMSPDARTFTATEGGHRVLMRIERTGHVGYVAVTPTP